MSASAEIAGTNYAATNGTEERKTTAQQIANNVTTNVGGEEYTLKATKTGDTWTYSLEGETAEATAAVATYTVTATTETVTVMDGSDPVESTTTIDNGLSEGAKNDVKDEKVEVAKNEEILDKAEDAGYEIIHHVAVEATCTEIGHTAYDSYYVNAEEVKVGYKEFAALGHNGSLETGLCTVCGARVYGARIGDVGYDTLSNAWSAGSGKTVVLLQSGLSYNALYAYGTRTLDLNGNTLTLKGHSAVSGAFGTDGGVDYAFTNLTIKNGTLNLSGANYNTYGIFNYGTLTLKDLTINSACQTVIYSIGEQWGSAGTTTLDNVTINSTYANGTAVAVYAYNSSYAGTVKPNAVIKDSTITAAKNAVMMYGVDATVENCNISATSDNALWISNSATGSDIYGTVTVKGNTTITAGSDYKRLNAASGHTIVVIEGTYNFDPSNNNSKSYVDTTAYTVIDNGDGTWTVTANE